MKRILFAVPFLLLFCASLCQGQITWPRGSMTVPTTVAFLPLIGNSNLLYDVRDGNPDCATGGGTTRVVCRWNGATYSTLSTSAGTVTSVSGVANETDSTGGAAPAIGLVPVPKADNFISGLTSTATAAGTTTLTVASKRTQVFTGSTTQTVALPDVTTLLQVGFSFDIQNDSSGALTINSSGGNLVQTMAAGTRAFFTCKLLTGTSAASWNVTYIAPAGVGGSGTVNSLAKFTPDGATLGDSRISDDGSSDAVVFNAGISVNGGSGADEIFFAERNAGSINGALGDFTEGAGATYLKIDDNNRQASLHAGPSGTESLTIDGTAHTIVNTAAGSVSNVTPLWGAGSDGAKFQLNSAGRIIQYGGAPPNDGYLLIGHAANGTFVQQPLIAGTGVSITPAAGSITIAQDPLTSGSVLSVLSANATLASATGTTYSSPGYGGTPLASTSEAQVGWVCPRAGTISKLYVITGSVAKVNTPATTITLRKAGADTAVTLLLTQTTATVSSDLTHSFSVAAGDVLTISFTTTGAAAVSTSIAGVSFLLN